MHRRGFIALAATVPFAGCGVLNGSDDSVSASLDATTGDMNDMLSSTFSASEGDEVEVHIEAGPDGATVSLMPEEAQTGMGGDDPVGNGPEDIGFPWFLDANEEITDTVTIRRSEDHLFWITEGQAEAEAAVISD